MLAAPAEGDETASLLRVIMNELSNVKSQVTTLQTYPAARRLYPQPGETIDSVNNEFLEDASNVRRESILLLKMFETEGIINGCMLVYLIPRKVVREMIMAAEGLNQFSLNLLPMMSTSASRSLEALLKDKRRYGKLSALYNEERANVLSAYGQLHAQPGNDNG